MAHPIAPGSPPFPVRQLLLSGALPGLRELDVGENQLGDEWMMSLVSVLRGGGLPSLRVLDVSDNAITDQGASELLALLTDGRASGLRAISLQGNPISPDLEAQVQAAVPEMLPGECAETMSSSRIAGSPEKKEGVDGAKVSEYLGNGRASPSAPAPAPARLGESSNGRKKP
jgi:hypothetical protein